MPKGKERFLKHFLLTTAALLLVICLAAGGGCAKSEIDANSTDPKTTDTVQTDLPALPTQEPTAEPTQIPEDFYTEKTYSFVDDIALFKIDGRSTLTSKGVTCDWSAGGFEVCGAFRGDVSLELTVTGDGFLTVYLDGERLPENVRIKKNTVIASNVPEGMHTLAVYKQTEVRSARLVLKSLTLNGTLTQRPADRPLFIEFIGDSISTGYGTNLKEGASGEPSHTDATMAYPFIVANALGADFDVTAVIGIGLVKGYVSETMGKIYGLADYYRSAKTAYEPARTPSAVVINLGTNDATMSSDSAKYEQAVKNLIALVRETYGSEVPVLWVYNSMRSDYSKYTLSAISDLGGEAANIYSLQLIPDASAYGHPSAAAHVRHAQSIEAKLREILKL